MPTFLQASRVRVPRAGVCARALLTALAIVALVSVAAGALAALGQEAQELGGVLATGLEASAR